MLDDEIPFLIIGLLTVKLLITLGESVMGDGFDSNFSIQEVAGGKLFFDRAFVRERASPSDGDVGGDGDFGRAG